MPIYNVKAPDGKTYKVQGPENADEGALIETLHNYLSTAKAPAPQPSTERTALEAVTDVPVSLLKGLGSMAQLPGQVYGLATGDFDTAAMRGPKKAQEFAESLKSQGLKAREAQQASIIAEAAKNGVISEGVAAVASTIKDPALFTSFIAEQVPQLLPALLTGGLYTAATTGAKQLAKYGSKEAAEAAARAGAVKVALGTGAAQQGAGVGTDTYQEALDLAAKQYPDMSLEDRQALALSKARATAGEAGIISLLAQRLPGGRAIERRLAGVPGEGRIRSALGETASEMIEEGGGKFASNVNLQQIDPTRSLTQGVGQAAGLGAIGGGVLGGAIGRGAPAAPLQPGQIQGESLEQTTIRLQQEILNAQKAITNLQQGTTDPSAQLVQANNELIALATPPLAVANQIQASQAPTAGPAVEPAAEPAVEPAVEPSVEPSAASTTTPAPVSEVSTTPVVEPTAPVADTATTEVPGNVSGVNEPTQGEQDVTKPVAQPSGGSPAATVESAENAPAQGTGGVDRNGVVPAGQDVGVPVSGEGTPPVAVAPSAVKPVETAAETVATPTVETQAPEKAVTALNVEAQALLDQVDRAIEVSTTPEAPASHTFTLEGKSVRVPGNESALLKFKNTRLVKEFPDAFQTAEPTQPAAQPPAQPAQAAAPDVKNTITQMIDDGDVDNAVTYAEANNVNLDETFKDDKPRLSEVQAIRKARESLREKTGAVIPEQPKETREELEQQKAENTKQIEAEITEKKKQLTQVLKAILTRMGLKDVAVNLIEDIKSEEEGSYADRLMRIAVDANDPLRVLKHETVHALKELGFFTDSQWKSLTSQANSKWIDQYLKSRNVELDGKTMSRYDAYMVKYNGNMDMIVEEAIADAFGDFSVKAPPGMLAAITARMKMLFQGIKSALNGTGFYTSDQIAEQIFTKTAKGQLKAPKQKANQAGEPAKLSLRNKLPQSIASTGAVTTGEFTPSQQALLQSFEGLMGSRRVPAVDYALKNSKSDLEGYQKIDEPLKTKRGQKPQSMYGDQIEEIKQKIADLEAIQEEAQRRDDNDYRKETDRAILKQSRDELDTSIKAGTITSDQAKSLIKQAQATGNVASASDLILDTLDKAEDAGKPLLPAPGRLSLRTIPDTKEFKQWSRDKPVIRYEKTDEYKGGAAVFQAFHGTTHTNIETFDVYKGNKDGALGAGSYLTTSPKDASANYAGIGPDLTARIAREEESLSESFYDDAYLASEMLNDYFQDNKIDNEVTDDNFDELKDKYGEKAINHAAQKALKGDSEGLVMPMYVRMLKPFDMRPNGLVLDYSYKTDDQGDPIAGSEQGALIDFLEAARNVLSTYNPNEEFTSSLLENGADGISAKEIFDIATKTLSDNYDDNGDMVSSGHIIQEIAREAGYDGLIQDANSYFGTGRRGFGGLRVPSMAGVNEGVLHLMPFKDNQLKSAIGNKGTYSEKGNIKFSLRDKLGMYSELENKIEAGSNKAPAASWKAYINGLTQKGVKPDEIEWSGVKDWLDLQKGIVTKDELLNYLKEGGVKVDEVVLDDFTPQEDETDFDTGRYLEPGPKYGTYTLPGGENYREVLLTLPVKLPSGWKIEQQQGGSGLWGLFNAKGEMVTMRPTKSAIEEIAVKYAMSGAYKSSHWNQPNILAHIRVNDRIDADSNKVLFVEEIQSDWGQEGKKKGFAQQGAGPAEIAYREYEAGLNKRYEALLRKDFAEDIKDPNRIELMVKKFMDKSMDIGARAIALGEKETLNQYTRAWNNELRAKEKAILAAPFVATKQFTVYKDGKELVTQNKEGKDVRHRYDNLAAAQTAATKFNGEVRNMGMQANTEGWLNLALKRIMVMAAEGGYDKVAFVRGGQAAERFSLDKQVKLIRAVKQSDGKWTLWAVPIDSNISQEITPKNGAAPEALEELVGKEMADKIINETGAVVKTGASDDFKKNVRDYEGNDLKIEAKGMRAFYDSIVPGAVKKLLPKVGGDQMKTVEMSYDPNPELDKWEAEDGESDGSKAAVEQYKQPGFDVTPAMQDKVKTTGLPRFSLRSKWSDERIDSLINQYSYLQNGREGDTKAYATFVKPSDFLNATATKEYRKELEKERTSLDVKKLAKQSQPIYLDVQKDEEGVYQIVGHEGRHRMMALRDEGVDTGVPVVLNIRPSEAVKNAVIVDEPYFKPQKFGDGSAPKGFFTQEMIPISWKHKDDIKDAFGGKAEIKFSLRSTFPQSTQASIDRITTAREDKGFIARMMEAIAPTAFSTYRQQYLNRYNQLGKYDKMLADQLGVPGLLADASSEAAALLSDNGAGLTASALGVHDRVGGIPVFRNGVTIISNVNNTVGGPMQIFAKLTELGKGDPYIYQSYQQWAGAKRASRFNAQGIDTPYTAADLQEAKNIEARYPQFVNIQKDYVKFNDGLVQYMLDTGIISEENAKKFSEHSDYIPFYRQLDGEATIGPNIFQAISGVKPPRKLKGNKDAPLADFMETIVRNTQSIIQAGVKNTAAQRAVNVAMQLGPNFIVPLNTTSPDPSLVVVLEKGLKKYYKSSDPLWIESLKALNAADLPFNALISGPANLLRTMVTKDPGFMLANMMRDSLAAHVTSGIKMTPIVDTIKNFGAAIAGQSPEFQKLLNAGILGGYDFSQNIEYSGKVLSKELRKKTGTTTTTEKVLSPFTGLWSALEKGTTASDAATRIEVYKKTLAATGNEAEALFRALEVMNFNRKGSSPVIRVITAAIPFLNARIQGLDVLYRAAFGQINSANAEQIQKSFFIRGAQMMALSAMYWALTHDDEEYKKQESETRDNYWLLPSLGIKIPIPFEIGILFKVIPERILAYSFGDDTGQDFIDSMTRQLKTTLMINPVPQTVLPALEAYTNKSFFTQRAIVGQGLEDVAPGYQVGPGTTNIAADIGKALNISPMKLDHMIKGYTGTMGMYMLDVVDSVYSMNSDIEKPSKRIDQMPILKRFMIDPEARGTVTAYYDMKNAVSETVRTSNLLERSFKFNDQAEYLQENGKMLVSEEYVKTLEKTMKQFREMKLMIRASTMSGDEKQDALKQITAAENKLTSNIQAMKKALQ